jgi:hypothetical protein
MTSGYKNPQELWITLWVATGVGPGQREYYGNLVGLPIL